jgi:hypothetical protein
MLEKILDRLEADLEKGGFWNSDSYSYNYSYNAINDLLESYQKEGWEFEFDIDFIEYLNPKQPNIVSFSLAWIKEGKLMTQVVLWEQEKIKSN